MTNKTEIKIDTEMKLNQLPHVSFGITFFKGKERVRNQKNALKFL
jgi:hypothetical protein